MTDFKEYSMTRPGKLARYVGFTEDEVKRLCDKYQMEFGDMRAWYDGYSFSRIQHVYSPNSVMNALQEEEILNYWTQTESFESLKKYIEMNKDGLKDDVLTLLIHLGYLAYAHKTKEIYIPNREVADVFQSSVKGRKWKTVEQAIGDANR